MRPRKRTVNTGTYRQITDDVRENFATVDEAVAWGRQWLAVQIFPRDWLDAAWQVACRDIRWGTGDAWVRLLDTFKAELG